MIVFNDIVWLVPICHDFVGCSLSDGGPSCCWCANAVWSKCSEGLSDLLQVRALLEASQERSTSDRFFEALWVHLHETAFAKSS